MENTDLPKWGCWRLKKDQVAVFFFFFNNVYMPSCVEPMLSVASDFCFWLTKVEPKVDFSCLDAFLPLQSGIPLTELLFIFLHNSV